LPVVTFAKVTYDMLSAGLEGEKISAGMVTLPSSPFPLKLALSGPLIDADISDQLPKSQKTACKHTGTVSGKKHPRHFQL